MTFAEMEVELDRIHNLPFPPSDYQTHWEGLQDMPREALAGAVKRAAKTCERFPAPAELRGLADAVRLELPSVDRPSTPLAEPKVFTSKFLSKPIVVDREWSYYCDDCSDTGMFSYWCDRHPGSTTTRKPWMTVAQPCSMQPCQDNALYPHEWVGRCACWNSNPSLVRKRLEQAKWAEQRTVKGRS